MPVKSRLHRLAHQWKVVPVFYTADNKVGGIRQHAANVCRSRSRKDERFLHNVQLWDFATAVRDLLGKNSVEVSSVAAQALASHAKAQRAVLVHREALALNQGLAHDEFDKIRMIFRAVEVVKLIKQVFSHSGHWQRA